MKTSRFHVLTTLLAMVLILGGGCYNDYILTPDGGGDIQGDVTFAADILPIFQNNCSTSGCHSPGGQKPDLSTSNAFTSLTNGNYFSIATPEDSEIYKWMKGLKALPMPPSGSNATNTAKVLAWIKQGAQNN